MPADGVRDLGRSARRPGLDGGRCGWRARSWSAGLASAVPGDLAQVAGQAAGPAIDLGAGGAPPGASPAGCGPVAPTAPRQTPASQRTPIGHGGGRIVWVPPWLASDRSGTAAAGSCGRPRPASAAARAPRRSQRGWLTASASAVGGGGGGVEGGQDGLSAGWPSQAAWLQRGLDSAWFSPAGRSGPLSRRSRGRRKADLCRCRSGARTSPGTGWECRGPADAAGQHRHQRWAQHRQRVQHLDVGGAHRAAQQLSAPPARSAARPAAEQPGADALFGQRRRQRRPAGGCAAPPARRRAHPPSVAGCSGAVLEPPQCADRWAGR